MTKKVKCPVCNGRGLKRPAEPHGGMIALFPCEHCNGTGRVEVPITNADRIRSMTDEELAASHLIIPCFYDDDGFGECKFGWHDREQTCEECRLEWLKQPYVERKDNG